jgi:hypothetical protein
MMEALVELLGKQVEVTTRLIGKQEDFLAMFTKTTEDHEKRIRMIERIIGYGTGVLGTIVLMLKVLGKI